MPVAIAAIARALVALAPWVLAAFVTWKLERAGAVDAVAVDVKKAAEAGGDVLDVTKGAGLPIAAMAIALVALLVLRR